MRKSKWQLALSAALGVALVSTSVSAAPGATRPNTGKTHPKGTANANTNAVTVLHQVHGLLATANHDYDGHRAKAVHHVSQAIHELGGTHKGTNKGANANANGNGPAIREPQAQSDAQLQQAIQLLNGLQGQVANAKAAEHLKEAIAELNTALKIK
jgi:hypothetical protein